MLYADASNNFRRADVWRMMHLNCSWVFNDCSWVSLRCRLTCKLHMPGARQACCHGNQVERCVSGLWGYPRCACTHPVEEESAVRRPGRGGRCERSRLSQPQSPSCCFTSASLCLADCRPLFQHTHRISGNAQCVVTIYIYFGLWYIFCSFGFTLSSLCRSQTLPALIVAYCPNFSGNFNWIWRTKP